MDDATFHALLSPDGQAALAAAAGLRPTEAAFLAAFETLRKRWPPALAKAALEIVLLRQKARTKFTLAPRMYFTREALEQASGEVVARYRAGRLAGYPTVLDLCCGIGADTIALAAANCRVSAHDWDPLRLAMAAENVAIHGLADRVTFTVSDVSTPPWRDEAAAFIDPGRRAGERRFLDPDRYQPPLGKVIAGLPAGFPLAAKVAPGIARSDRAKWDAEAEFISVDGELKECVLWFGPLRTASQRATVIRTSHSSQAEDGGVALLTGVGPSSGANLPSLTGKGDGGASLDVMPVEPREYVFDPDPAVIRADLLSQLAGQLAAAPVDHGVAFLTAHDAVQSPFAACYRVEHAAPFHVGKLREYCREYRIGRGTVLKRAVDLDTDEVTRKLKLDGPEHRWLVLVRVLGRAWAIVAERVG